MTRNYQPAKRNAWLIEIAYVIGLLIMAVAIGVLCSYAV